MKKILAVQFIFFFCVGLSFGEYIYLKTGEEFESKIVAETNDSITITVGGKRRKIFLKDIEEISLKKKVTAKIPDTKDADIDNAKTQFSSKSKHELPDSETIVSDNKSGVVVYSVKETTIEKKQIEDENKNDSGKSSAGVNDINDINTEGQPQTQKEASDDFDAAAFLLSGNNQFDSPKNAPEIEAVKKEDRNVKKRTIEKDYEYDARKFVVALEDDSDVLVINTEIVSEDEADNLDVAEDVVASARSTRKEIFTPNEEKPKNETFLAIAFDLKGVNIFNGTLKSGGVDLGGDLTENSDYGISVSVEQYGYLTNLLALGAGIGFEFSRGLEETAGKFSLLPMYMSCKMRIISEELYHVYAVGHIGYNFLIGNSSYLEQALSRGGLYYAGGVGASYNRYVFQVLYAVNHGNIHYSNSAAGSKIDRDIMFSKIGFHFGYLF